MTNAADADFYRLEQLWGEAPARTFEFAVA